MSFVQTQVHTTVRDSQDLWLKQGTNAPKTGSKWKQTNILFKEIY